MCISSHFNQLSIFTLYFYSIFYHISLTVFSPLQFFFLLYSIVTQLQYILTFFFLSLSCSVISDQTQFSVLNSRLSLLFSSYFFCLFIFSRAVHGHMEIPRLQLPIGAVAASLHHGHSNMGSKLHLRPTYSSRQGQILNPLSKARDQTHNLMVPSWIC